MRGHEKTEYDKTIIRGIFQGTVFSRVPGGVYADEAACGRGGCVTGSVCKTAEIRAAV